MSNHFVDNRGILQFFKYYFIDVIIFREMNHYVEEYIYVKLIVIVIATGDSGTRRKKEVSPFSFFLAEPQ